MICSANERSLRQGINSNSTQLALAVNGRHMALLPIHDNQIADSFNGAVVFQRRKLAD